MQGARSPSLLREPPAIPRGEGAHAHVSASVGATVAAGPAAVTAPGSATHAQTHGHAALRPAASGAAPSASAGACQRVILHIDVDAFFVQSERERDPSLRGVPVAVQQHQDTISLSYEARALGIKKHAPPTQIRANFPSVRLVHVHTIDGKASYKYYRDASRRIFNVICGLCSQAHANTPVERRGMDEAYIDASMAVRARPGATPEEALTAGAVFAEQLRSAVERSTGYICSVGVAQNKLLAKLASRAAKPAGVFVATPEAAANLLRDLLVSQLPGMGGQVSRKLATLGVEYVHQLPGMPRETLAAALPLRGDVTVHTLLAFARGEDDAPVVATGPPKSIQSQCALSPLVLPDFAVGTAMGPEGDDSDGGTGPSTRIIEPVVPYDGLRLRNAVRILADDMLERVVEDSLENHRYPTQLVVGVQLFSCRRGDVIASHRLLPLDRLDSDVERAMRAKIDRCGAPHPPYSNAVVDVLDHALVQWPRDAADARIAEAPDVYERMNSPASAETAVVLTYTKGADALRKAAGQSTSRSTRFPEGVLTDALKRQAAGAASLRDQSNLLAFECMRVLERAVNGALDADGWDMRGGLVFDSVYPSSTSPAVEGTDAALAADREALWAMNQYSLPVAVVKLNVAASSFLPGRPSAGLEAYFGVSKSPSPHKHPSLPASQLSVRVIRRDGGVTREAVSNESPSSPDRVLHDLCSPQDVSGFQTDVPTAAEAHPAERHSDGDQAIEVVDICSPQSLEAIRREGDATGETATVCNDAQTGNAAVALLGKAHAEATALPGADCFRKRMRLSEILLLDTAHGGRLLPNATGLRFSYRK